MGFAYDPYGLDGERGRSEDDPAKRAFGHPLGTDPDDPERLAHVVDWAGKGLSLAGPALEKYKEPIVHAAEEAGPTVSNVTKQGLKILPGVGVGISAGLAGYEAYKLGKVIQEDGLEGAFHDQRFYNAQAGVQSNAVHAALGGLTMCPITAPVAAPIDAAITAAEVTTDLAGGFARMAFGEKAGFDSNSVEGGLLRGTQGDRSSGYDAGRWVSNKLGPGMASGVAGALTMGVVNAVDMPFNLVNTAYRGLTGEYQTAKDGVDNGEGLMGYDKTHGLNPLALPENNPVLMKLGLGGGKHPASHSEGAGGSAGSHSEGAGGGAASHAEGAGTHSRARGSHVPSSLGAGVGAVARW